MFPFIYTVITRLEESKLNAEIEKIDPNTFVITSSVKDTRAGMIKKRPQVSTGLLISKRHFKVPANFREGMIVGLRKDKN
jgi:Uncharacterized protein conserved in bacteria (DUF2179)